MSEVDTSGFGESSIDTVYEGPRQFKPAKPKNAGDVTDVVVRFLPAMKSYKNTGKWRFYYNQHFGYNGVNSRKPDEDRFRPFACIEERDWNNGRAITVHCAACDEASEKRKHRDAILGKIKAKYPDMDEKSTAFRDILDKNADYRSYQEWFRNHNIDRKWWVNAMDQNGAVGHVLIGSKLMKEQLLPLMKELQQENGIDALSPKSGVWFRITRTGMGLQTTYGVKVVKEVQEVPGLGKMERPKTAPMTQEQINKALEHCLDLQQGAVKTLTAAQIKAVVEANGDREAIDEIWDGPKAQEASSAADIFGDDDVPDFGAEVSPEPIVGGLAKPTVSKTTAVQVEDPDEVALAALLLKKKQKEEAAAATKKAAPSFTPTQDESTEDFLSKYSPK